MKRFLPKDPNVRILAICVTVVGSMVAAAYAAVPLYDLFCRVTGYGGTTQVAEEDSRDVLDRTVPVRFDASNSRDCPWEFEPAQRRMEVNVGETGLAYYRATNPTDRTITATATYNVSPFKAAPYFSKIECFCFTAQTLGPGESTDMPVMFFVDPDMDDEDRLDDVRTITLSYTFWETEESLSRAAESGGAQDRS